MMNVPHAHNICDAIHTLSLALGFDFPLSTRMWLMYGVRCGALRAATTICVGHRTRVGQPVCMYRYSVYSTNGVDDFKMLAMQDNLVKPGNRVPLYLRAAEVAEYI